MDKISIATDETLTYKLTIASPERKISQPELPKFENFYILSQAQSSTVSLGKSKIKTILVYTYILAPKEIGKFKIEPSQIKIKGKVYSSESFEIAVTAGKVPPLAPPEKEEPIPPQESRPEPDEAQITL